MGHPLPFCLTSPLSQSLPANPHFQTHCSSISSSLQLKLDKVFDKISNINIIMKFIGIFSSHFWLSSLQILLVILVSVHLNSQSNLIVFPLLHLLIIDFFGAFYSIVTCVSGEGAIDCSCFAFVSIHLKAFYAHWLKFRWDGSIACTVYQCRRTMLTGFVVFDTNFQGTCFCFMRF